jgi:hypothetical protein
MRAENLTVLLGLGNESGDPLSHEESTTVRGEIRTGNRTHRDDVGANGRRHSSWAIPFGRRHSLHCHEINKSGQPTNLAWHSQLTGPQANPNTGSRPETVVATRSHWASASKRFKWRWQAVQPPPAPQA